MHDGKMKDKSTLFFKKFLKWLANGQKKKPVCKT